MALQAADIVDVMKHTHHDFDRMKMEDLVTDYRNTIAFKRLFNESAEFGTGDACDFYMMTDHNHSAGSYGLDQTDLVTHPNVLATGSVPWRHFGWYWALSHHLVAMNGTPNKILEYAKTQYIAGLASFVVYTEQTMWRAASATSDDPLGIPNWIVKNNTTGFNGGNASGFTTTGNVNLTDVSRFKNYTAQYTALTRDDFITKLRRAAEMTKFEKIVDDIPDHKMSSMGLYAGYDGVVAPLESILESQNDNLGNDIAPRDGKVVFRGMPITTVPELEEDTTNPIYMIPWGVFKFKKLKNVWGKKTHYANVPGQRHMSAEFCDYSGNTVCYNRRKCAVLAKDTTMP